MELLGDVGHVEFRFSPFGDSVCMGARYVHGLHQMNHSSEISLDAPMVLQGDETQVEARFVLFGDTANLDAR